MPPKIWRSCIPLQDTLLTKKNCCKAFFAFCRDPTASNVSFWTFTANSFWTYWICNEISESVLWNFHPYNKKFPIIFGVYEFGCSACKTPCKHLSNLLIEVCVASISPTWMIFWLPLRPRPSTCAKCPPGFRIMAPSPMPSNGNSAFPP